MWKRNGSSPSCKRNTRAVILKLEKWLRQIPETTSEISAQKNALLGTAEILPRTQVVRFLLENLKLRIIHITHREREKNFFAIFLRSQGKNPKNLGRTLR